MILAQPEPNQSYYQKIEIGDFNGAAQELEQKKELNLFQKISLLQCYLEQKDQSKMDSLSAHVKVEPDNPNYPLFCSVMGMVIFRKKDREGALALNQIGLEKANQETPYNCAIWAELKENIAIEFYLKKEFEEAKKLIVEAATAKEKCGANPFSTMRGYYNCFKVYYFSSDHDNAKKYAEKAAEWLDKVDQKNKLAADVLSVNGIIADELGAFEESIKYEKKAIALTRKRSGVVFDGSLAKHYYNISTSYGYLEDVDGVMTYLDTVQMLHDSFGIKLGIQSRMLLKRAAFTNDLEKREALLKQALTLKSKLPPHQLNDVFNAYNHLGVIESKRGNYAEAINYYLRAKAHLETHKSISRSYWSYLYFNLGSIEEKRGNTQKAIESVKIGLRYVRDKYGDDHYRLIQHLQGLGELYISKKDFEKAEKVLFEAERISKIHHTGTNPTFGLIYRSFAHLYQQKGDPKKGIAYAEKAIQSLYESPIYGIDNLPKNYRILGKSHKDLGDMASAKYAFRQMLESNGFQFESDGNLSIENIPNHKFWTAMTSLVYFIEEQDGAPLNDKMIEVSLDLLKRTQANFFFESSEFESKKRMKELVVLLLDDQFEKWNQNKKEKHLASIFELIEFYKSGALNRPFLRKQTRLQNALPKELLREEKNIIYQYEKAVQEYEELAESTDEEVEEKTKELQSKLIELQERKETFVKKLKTYFPDYHQLRYGQTAVSLAEAESSVLKTGVQYLSNFWGERYNYSIFIGAENSFVFRSEIEKLQPKLSSLRSQLANNEQSDNEANFVANRQKFIEGAHELYQILIAPIEPFFENEKPLCIIPDHQLCYLPFDVLLTESPQKNNFKSLPYLLRKATLFYDVSVTYNLKNQFSTSSKKHAYIGFAPTVLGAENQSAEVQRGKQILLANTKEIEIGSALFSGLGFYGEAATKEQFLTLANQAEILHLSMHGQVDNRIPMNSALAFYQGDSTKVAYLKMSEIAQQELDNQLVILSACETQTGQLAEGEGLLSLTRAFQLAGSPNLINTFWSVNDLTAEQVISSFLKGLKSNQNCSESLRQAKLEYLNSSSEYYAHPSFWAPFSYSGQHGLEVGKRGFGWWWFALGGLLVLGFLFVKTYFSP